MGKLHESISDRLAAFMLAQPVFFVATAPSAADGHVNLSPKGLGGTFAVLDPHRVAYLDYTGSGVETIAHLRENGRIVIMFCAFDGPPNIVRVHGHGEPVFPSDPRFPLLRAAFPPAGRMPEKGLRSIIEVTADRISDSCGYAVPLMDFREHRDVLDRWTERKTADQLDQYHLEKNSASIDGLPGLLPVPAAQTAQAGPDPAGGLGRPARPGSIVCGYDPGVGTDRPQISPLRSGHRTAERRRRR